jgi:hypothetical protein
LTAEVGSEGRIGVNEEDFSDKKGRVSRGDRLRLSDKRRDLDDGVVETGQVRLEPVQPLPNRVSWPCV